jgi:hypothetical protein
MNILKTEILSISVTGGRFPRVVRVPPQAKRMLVTKALPHDVALFFVPFLCGVTPGHTFPAGDAALHFNQMT